MEVTYKNTDSIFAPPKICIINSIPETNSIYFNGDIDSSSMENLTNKLLQMEISVIKKQKKIDKIIDEARNKIIIDEEFDNIKIDVNYNKININLYITTNGGSVYDVFAIIDVIKSMKIPVHTICKGCVASAGTLLSLAGKKRYITKNSYMLIHEIRSGCWGKFTYLTENYNNSQQIMDHIKSYYIENTKITKEELDNQLKQDIFWNATTCLEKGIVDEIIDYVTPEKSQTT